jgi:hypothetical protein
LPKKLIKSAICILLGGSNPNQDVQVLQETEDLLPVILQYAVEVRKIAQKDMPDRIPTMSDFPPWDSGEAQLGNRVGVRVPVDQDPVRVRSAMARGGNF